MTCRTRGCTRPADGESFYGRCAVDMWCTHCDVKEVRVGQVCDTCREYERTHEGRPRPMDLIELQRRRFLSDDR